jgi:hypothetical protein
MRYPDGYLGRALPVEVAAGGGGAATFEIGDDVLLGRREEVCSS